MDIRLRESEISIVFGTVIRSKENNRERASWASNGRDPWLHNWGVEGKANLAGVESLLWEKVSTKLNLGKIVKGLKFWVNANFSLF